MTRRFLAWLFAFIRVYLGSGLDRMLGRATLERRLARIERALHGMGPTAVKIGQQLAHRIDLLPMAAHVLGRMKDHATPFSVNAAVARIEADIGRPLEEAFDAFDPVPIASSAIDCSYQALVLGGEAVVVRVRRPGARLAFGADLAALNTLTSLLEMSTLLRPGFLEHVRTEVSAVVVEELDFHVQARYQTLLRRRLRKDGIQRLSTARVHHELLSHRVMVSEFVSGLRLSELMGMLAEPSPDDRMIVASLDIDPRKVARTLLEYVWWSLFENPFFHVDTDPNQVVVTHGGGIGIIGFGHFATAQGKTRRLVRELFRRMAIGEISGAAEVVVQALSPLPFIDVDAFSKRLEARLWQQYFAMKDGSGPWSERTSAGVWHAILEVAAEDSVPVHQDLGSMLRAAVSVEELALRLDPNLALLRAFRRYLRHAERRTARRFQRKLDRNKQSLETGVYATTDRVLRLADRMTFFAESFSENLPISNLALSSKASTVISELLNYLVRTSALVVVGAVGLGLWRLWRGGSLAPGALFREVLGSPVLWGVAIVLLLISLRRSQFRLKDKDSET